MCVYDFHEKLYLEIYIKPNPWKSNYVKNLIISDCKLNYMEKINKFN